MARTKATKATGRKTVAKKKSKYVASVLEKGARRLRVVSPVSAPLTFRKPEAPAAEPQTVGSPGTELEFAL